MDMLQRKGWGSKPLCWGEPARDIFQDTKRALCTEPILNHPYRICHLSMYKDASNIGLAVVLIQNIPKGEQPIFFLSHRLIAPEHNYAVIEKESLAIRWTVKELKYYRWGRQLTVVTDRAPLQWLNCMKYSDLRLMCLHLALQPY